MARDFNGSTGKLNNTSGAAIDATSSYSMAAWVWPDNTSAVRRIIGCSNTGTSDEWCSLAHDNAGELRLQTFNASFNTTLDGGAISTTGWTHVGASVDAAGGADSAKIYVNGVEVNSGLGRASDVNQTEIGVLERTSAQQHFLGLIGECAMWQALLSADEFAALADGLPAYLISSGNLAGYWPIFGEASPEPDIGGSLPLTLSGTATKAEGPPVYRPGIILPFAIPAAAGGDTEVSANVDALTLTENAATVSLDVNIAAGVDALTLTEQAATVSLDVDIATNVDALTLTEQAATVSLGVNVAAGVDSLTLTGNAAAITSDVNVAADVHALTLNTFSASVVGGAARTAARGGGLSPQQIAALHRLLRREKREDETRSRREREQERARELKDVYDRIHGLVAPEDAAPIAAAVKPYSAPSDARIPPVQAIDWRALSRSMAAVEALSRALLEIDRLRAEEEDTLMLLVMAA